MCNIHKQFLTLVSLLWLVILTQGEEISLPCGQKITTAFHTHEDSNAVLGQWPWLVAIYNNDEFQCSGSIINQNTILTAAHCVYTENGVWIPYSQLSVHVGRDQLIKSSEHMQVHYFVTYSNKDVDHDIALIGLSSNITMTDYVQPVCLWLGDSEQNSIGDKNGTIIRFGYDERDELSGQLKQSAIQVVKPFTCIQMNRDVYAPLLTPDVFCGIEQADVNACNGDSGGGLFFEVKGIWFVRGLVSYSPGRGNLTWNMCDPLKPTVYTDVAKYVKWIREHIYYRQLVYEKDLFGVDYEEKLRLFNFESCGMKSNSCYNFVQNWTVPWLGFVQNDNLDNFCVITLISEWYAVGPVYCFDDFEYKYDSIILGGYHRDVIGTCSRGNQFPSCSYPAQRRQVKNIYKYIDSELHYGDNIALIELLTPADTTQPNVKPICIPVTPRLRTKVTTNLHAAVLLKGVVNNIPVRYVEEDECKRQLDRRFLEDNQICAEIVNVTVNSSCEYYMSGSPLQEMKLINGTERYFLHGLDLFKSFGETTKLTSYRSLDLDWILYHMRDHTTEASNASGNSTANQSHESQRSMLQQQPGREKLRLFNMDTCGIAHAAAIQPNDHVPWIGAPFDHTMSFDLYYREERSAILISEWYALAPKGVVKTKTDWHYVVLGMKDDKRITEKEGMKNRPFQRVEIKNIINPPADQPWLKFTLIELVEPADLKNPHIRPICLPFKEKFDQLNATELVFSKKHEYLAHIPQESKKLTLVDHQTCQDWLLWKNGSVLEDNSTCAVDPYRPKPKYLKATFGDPIQMPVQFGDQLQYFLYGMNVKKNNSLSEKYGVYLFEKIELADLEWILDNMEEKERLTTTSNERVNLEPVQIPRSKSSLLNFDTCGTSSTTNPFPWIGRFACRSHDWVTSGSTVTLITDWYAVGPAHLNSYCAQYYRQRIVAFGYPCPDGILNDTTRALTNIIESCGAPTQWINVQKFIVHPHYNKMNFVNDIGLIRLVAPAKTSLPFVKPICLPVIDTIRSYDTSSLVIASDGYTYTNVEDRYVNLTKCQALWTNWKENVTIDNSNHCVMVKRTSDGNCCITFYGASLHSRQMLGSSEKNFLRGFDLDQRRRCSSYYPVVYTNTDAYLDWILENLDPPSS